MVFRICPRLTDRPPVCAPPPGSPDCGVRAGPPARGSLPIAGSTVALPSPPPPALFASARCAVSRSAPAFVGRPMSPTPKSARNNSPHPPPRGVAAGRPLLARLSENRGPFVHERPVNIAWVAIRWLDEIICLNLHGQPLSLGKRSHRCCCISCH